MPRQTPAALLSLALLAAVASSAGAATTTINTVQTGTLVPEGDTWLVVDGGTLTPNGSNTGTLQVGPDVSSGTTTVQYSFTTTATTSFAKLTGSGRVIVDGPATVFINRTQGDRNTYTGGTYLRSGTAVFSSFGAAAGSPSGQPVTGNVVFEGGSLQYPESGDGWNTLITLTELGGTFNANTSTVTCSINQTVSGTGVWTLLGAGTASISDPNSFVVMFMNPTCNFTGTTTVAGGKVYPSQNNVFGDPTQPGQANNKVILNGGAIYTMENAFRQFPTPIEVGPNGGYLDTSRNQFNGQQGNFYPQGGISGTGTLSLLGEGIVTLTQSNAFGGTLVTATGAFGAAQLNLQNFNALRNATLSQVTNGQVQFQVGAGTYYFGALSGSSQLNGNNQVSLNVGGNGQSTSYSGNLLNMTALTKTGTGTMTYTGTSVVDQINGTTVSGGVLAVNSDLALGAQSQFNLSTPSNAPVALNGGALKQTAAFDSARAFTIQNTGTIDTSAVGSGAQVNLSGNVTGSGDLTLAGNGDLTGPGTGYVALTGGNTYTGTTTLTSGMISAASTLGNAANTLVLNGGGLIAVGGGTKTNGYSTVIGLANGTLKASGASDVINQAGAMSGAGGLLKSGTGTANLQAANSFSGDTRIISGTLNLANANALQGSTLDMNAADAGVAGFTVVGNATYNVAGLKGTRGITFSSGTLSVGSNNASTEYSGALAGTGNLVKVGSGDLTLTGTNSYSGGTLVSAGRLVGTAAGIQGTVINNTVVEFAQATSGTYAGTMSGSGSLTKTGAGALTMSGTSSYTGGSTVSAGSLIGTTSSLQGSITNNAVVEFAQATAGTYAGAMTGSGSLTKSGAGALTLTAASTYAGATDVTAGTLVVNADNVAAAGVLTVASGATLAGSGTHGGAVALNAGSTVSPGNSPGTFTAASGTWAGGANYNWQLTDAAGTAGTNWDLFSFTGALDIAATSGSPFLVNLWTLSGTGPDVNGNASNFNANASYAWRIATAAGGVTGFAANKFTVNTAATNGAAGFANSVGSGQFSVANTGNDVNVVFTPAVVFDVTSGTQTQTQQGADAAMASAVSVTKTGAGAVVMNGNNTYSAATAVNGGSMIVTGTLANSAVTVAAGATLGGDGLVGALATIANSGTLAPGAAPTGLGILELGGLSLGSSATTVLAITGTTPGTDFDQVSILSGPLALGGTLDLAGSNIDGATVGTSYQLFDSAVTPTGSFSSLTALGGIYSGITWSGPVGGVWTSTNGTGGNYLTFTEGTGTLAVVPEPSTLAVIGLGLAGLAVAARRRR